MILGDTGISMLFYKIESLILRYSWLKLTLWFEENYSYEEMGAECEVSRALSETGFLGNTKKEEGEPSFLGNSEEQ